MKKTYIFTSFILLFLFENLQLNSQTNLVPNGNFEFFSNCPTTGGEINFALPWYDPNLSSSDYFNSCNQSSTRGVPCQNGCLYYQLPRSGNGYAAFYGYVPTLNNFREYIQIQFSTSLISNKCYYVEFYTNHANNESVAINNIGAYITNTAVSCPVGQPYNITPQILLSGNSVISDTLNWTKVSGFYHAQGGEDFITIGNFQNDSNTTVQIFDTTATALGEAYYYVDDVTVMDSASLGVEELDNPNYITLYPNPNNGQMTLSYHLAQAAELSIYDMQGRRLITYTLPPNNQTLNLNLEELNAGIYYYSLHTHDKQLKTEKLVIVK
ncbi:MAG: T9SS type A sorting domain-containing protein [Bacteroidota bacterium]